MNSSSDAELLRDQIATDLEAHSQSFKDDVLSGALPHERYKFDCGYIKGLADAAAIVSQTYDDLNSEEDDDAPDA